MNLGGHAAQPIAPTPERFFSLSLCVCLSLLISLCVCLSLSHHLILCLCISLSSLLVNKCTCNR